jgi:flagellar hook-length control protein FliK
MKINNEINNNFELLASSKHEQAGFSMLSELFSINFGEVFSENNTEENLNEFIFNEDEIKFVDYISNLIPSIEKDNKKNISFEKIETQISLDNSISFEVKEKILQFLNKAKNYLNSFQIITPKPNINKFQSNIGVAKITKKNSVIPDDFENLKKFDYNKPNYKNVSILDLSKNKLNKLDINKSVWDTQPNKVDETSVLSNKNTFIKKIKKNNHPNKIYQPMKSNTSVANQLKEVNLDKINQISENISKISTHNYMHLEPGKNLKNEMKSHNNQFLNINNTNLLNNSGQNLSHNNDSSFSSNSYNSVIENFLDHLDLTQKGWTSKLVSRIENAMNNGGEEIEFSLKPKNLGMLKVSVSQKNGMNTVKIITENSFVTSALAQNENYLQKIFNDQGMSLDFTAQNENHSFGSKSNFSQNSKNQNKNFNNEQSKRLNEITDQNDLVNVEDDSSRHIINVIA